MHRGSFDGEESPQQGSYGGIQASLSEHTSDYSEVNKVWYPQLAKINGGQFCLQSERFSEDLCNKFELDCSKLFPIVNDLARHCPNIRITDMWQLLALADKKEALFSELERREELCKQPSWRMGSPLCFAALGGHDELIVQLIQTFGFGIDDVTEPMYHQMSVAHFAAIQGHVDTIIMLHEDYKQDLMRSTFTGVQVGFTVFDLLLYAGHREAAGKLFHHFAMKNEFFKRFEPAEGVEAIDNTAAFGQLCNIGTGQLKFLQTDASYFNLEKVQQLKLDAQKAIVPVQFLSKAFPTAGIHSVAELAALSGDRGAFLVGLIIMIKEFPLPLWSNNQLRLTDCLAAGGHFDILQEMIGQFRPLLKEFHPVYIFGQHGNGQPNECVSPLACAAVCGQMQFIDQCLEAYEQDFQIMYRSGGEKINGEEAILSRCEASGNQQAIEAVLERFKMPFNPKEKLRELASRKELLPALIAHARVYAKHQVATPQHKIEKKHLEQWKKRAYSKYIWQRAYDVIKGYKDKKSVDTHHKATAKAMMEELERDKPDTVDLYHYLCRKLVDTVILISQKGKNIEGSFMTRLIFTCQQVAKEASEKSIALTFEPEEPQQGRGNSHVAN